MTTVWLHTHLPRLRAGDTPDVISLKIPGQRIAYASWVAVKGARFVVHERGRQRCIREGVRNVHAWVTGEEIDRLAGDWKYSEEGGYRPAGYRRAVYDPFKGGSFVDSETLEPLTDAQLVIMAGKNVFYAPEV